MRPMSSDPNGSDPNGSDPNGSDSKPPEAGGPDDARTAGAAASGVEGFTVELGPDVEKALEAIRQQAQKWLKKGRHTSVRLKFRGKELATVPLGALVAAEAASFVLFGPLRVLVTNLLGRAVLEVELVNEADAVVAAGRERLLEGELDLALEKFREAVAMDDTHPAAHLNLGIGLKLKGERDAAAQAFERAVALDPAGDTGREARRQLELLKARAP
jgi:tetratricopeptide (TPR) repeat protein